MNKVTLACVAISAGLMVSQSEAAPAHAFWARLDQDGPLSAGWVQVLPVLSTACNFRVDTSKLSETLVDLSRAPGNRDYTRDLYNSLYRIERRLSQNSFVGHWNQRFHGDQTAACATAEKLWGAAGTQFTGILVREASTDATATVNGTRPNNCQ
ncbi:hypothetical protein P7D22_16870 [Lichenihabitans sp. Uapishka_5]|uniref:hypothetical protein n=1 Tax=Lichenihabitans sp. Uapishka_5 TaxID=3037302 RepID=UPI0029E7F7B6|nr:hypothetical protein [Lichenihabitans sp. Uapishka_5]MDX7952843.1 hypothetical protein [Lichenihabitans sp. Uapishka_5]